MSYNNQRNRPGGDGQYNNRRDDNGGHRGGDRHNHDGPPRRFDNENGRHHDDSGPPRGGRGGFDRGGRGGGFDRGGRGGNPFSDRIDPRRPIGTFNMGNHQSTSWNGYPLLDTRDQTIP